MTRMLRVAPFLVAAALLLLFVGCSPEDVRETARAYYGDLAPEEFALREQELARVMAFYVTGCVLALVLSAIAMLNAMEHARTLGSGSTVRYGAYLFLLCFVGLFLATMARRSWLPAGYPGAAFGLTAVVGALGTSLAARLRPDRAILTVGYVAATLTLPLLGLLLNSEVYLIDTTASLFIGFATGMLITIVFSEPVRRGLVEFLARRDTPAQ